MSPGCIRASVACVSGAVSRSACAVWSWRARCSAERGGAGLFAAPSCSRFSVSVSRSLVPVQHPRVVRAAVVVSPCMRARRVCVWGSGGHVDFVGKTVSSCRPMTPTTGPNETWPTGHSRATARQPMTVLGWMQSYPRLPLVVWDRLAHGEGGTAKMRGCRAA